MNKYRPEVPSNWDMSPCPPDDHLAAYLDGTLEPARRAEVEAHAIECDDCRAVIAATADALATLQPLKPPRRLVGVGVTAVAAAAVLVLVLTRTGDTIRQDESVVRTPVSSPVGEDLPRFGVREPLGDAVIAANELVFAWDRLAPRTLYQVTVSDERGSVLWRSRTELVSLRPPPEVAAALTSGRIYYWRVEALLPDLRSATTPVQSFQIRAP